MRILIAGGTGVLGRRIVPLLLGAGHGVTVLARTPARAAPLAARGARVLQGDALDRAAVIAAVAQDAPDVIMHQLTDLAAGSSAANARLRIDATRNLADGALAAGVERIIVQSIAWCYAPEDRAATEDDPLDTISADPGRRTTVDAVISMEDSARRLGDAVLLRNGILYGPGTWYSPGGQVAAAARAGTLPADGDVTSFVHVDDAARAAVAALGWPAGTVNVVDDEPAAGSAWVPVFCAAVGAPVPSANPGRPHPWARGAVNGRARDLGWTPTFTSWRDGFAAEATVSTRGGRQCMPW